jgi:hypothetical protein
LDSEFTAKVSFGGNTVQTVTPAVVGERVIIGNGAATHERYNGDGPVERFELEDDEIQNQSLKYVGDRARTFEIEFHCQLNRVGGGTVLIGLAIYVNGEVVSHSINETDVGNRATSGFATATLELEPDDTVSVFISNNSNITNVIVNSAHLTVSLN